MAQALAKVHDVRFSADNEARVDITVIEGARSRCRNGASDRRSLGHHVDSVLSQMAMRPPNCPYRNIVIQP